jgi:hypothetical protein
VADKKQSGDRIKSVLRAVDANLPIRLIAATKSKAARFRRGPASPSFVTPDLIRGKGAENSDSH